MAVHGTRNRESVSWDYAGVLQVLTDVAREHTGLPLLRCYWYEATVEGSSRSDEHNTLAACPTSSCGWAGCGPAVVRGWKARSTAT